jgi:methylenetetrahydromethanopterin dehydrogenase
MEEAQPLNIGVYKCGHIGSSLCMELLLDELADRKDIKAQTVSSGSKMNPEAVQETFPVMLQLKPDLLIVVCPNAAMPGPAKALEIAVQTKLPTIVITDAPGKRAKAELERQGLGYIIVTGDPLIGARREFLDPITMALFNSDINKVLAITGVYRILVREIDGVIYELEAKQPPVLPRLVIDLGVIRDQTFFSNPYAKAKAMAAYAMAEKIADIDTQACFIEKTPDKYVLLAASAHEMAQTAARLAEDAREIEKSNDTLLREPHAKSGKTKTKTQLMQQPTFKEPSAGHHSV